jgi:hypothetical protein
LEADSPSGRWAILCDSPKMRVLGGLRTKTRNEIPLAPNMFFQVSRVRCGLPIIQSLAWRGEVRSGYGRVAGGGEQVASD